MRFTTSVAVPLALMASLVQAAPTFLDRRGHPAAPAPVDQPGTLAMPPMQPPAPPAPPANSVPGKPMEVPESSPAPPASSPGGGLNLGECSPPTNPGGIEAGQGAAGALYWMTNEPDGNFVMSASISNDGQLTFGDRFWTGGIGAHGVTDPVDSPDPLFSQSSVKAVGQNLVVVNAGSNTVTMFTIDPANPAKLSMAGGPVWSGGEFPCSATIDRATGNVCVLNGGAMNSVSCFSSDPASGLKMLPNSNRPLGLNVTTPPAGPADTASQILFSADGSQLFASIKGNPDAPGFIAAWDVAQDGSLSEDFQANVPTDGGALPFSMTLIDGASNTAILNTDPALGFSVYDFSQGLVSTDVGITIDGQSAACWSQFSRTTGNYYITDIGTSQLTEVEVNPDTLEARVVKQYAQPSDSSTIDNEIVNIAGQDFIYIMSPGTMRIEVLRLAAPEDAQPVQSFDIAEAARIAGITISTANLQGATGFSAAT